MLRALIDELMSPDKSSKTASPKVLPINEFVLKENVAVFSDAKLPMTTLVFVTAAALLYIFISVGVINIAVISSSDPLSAHHTLGTEEPATPIGEKAQDRVPSVAFHQSLKLVPVILATSAERVTCADVVGI